MDKLNESLINLSTSTIGIIGAVTQNPVVQAAAYIPSIAKEIKKCIGRENLQYDKELDSQLKQLFAQTCERTQDQLTPSLQDVIRYANARIEYKDLESFQISKLEDMLHSDLNDHIRSENLFITYKDISTISELFIKEFILLVPSFPKLSIVLTAQTIFDHEKRITRLEQRSPAVEMRRIHPESSFSDDIKYYCDKFEEPLFMHKHLPKEKTVYVKDVYTIPSAELCGTWAKTLDKTKDNSILDSIKQFLTFKPSLPGCDYYPILFVEGQAAMGKSSLISWLSWQYMHKTENINNLLLGRRLICVKLRDLQRSNGEVLNRQQPFSQIMAYLLFHGDESCIDRIPEKTSEFKELFNHSLLILDGFDELCLIEKLYGDKRGKSIYFTNMVHQLERSGCDCKVIVTTRPTYLDIESLDFPKAHITISPFDASHRIKWFSKFEKKQHTSEAVREIICDAPQELTGIIESPLTLYMIAAKEIQITDKSNLWNIYNQVFGKEIYKRSYEIGEPHPIDQYQNLLFALIAEIAADITEEQHLAISVEKLLKREKIRDIINKLQELQENESSEYESLVKVLEDCFGLASYFKSDGKNGIEFYHNNIKDYFLCEYICLNLERIYATIPSNRIEREKWFLKSFQELFQYSTYLKNTPEGNCGMPITFFESKLRFLSQTDNLPSFIMDEIDKKYFKHFFGKMLQTGMLFSYGYTGEDSILNMITCIYASVFSIFHTVYLAAAENALFEICEDDQTVDISTSFIFRHLFLTANIRDYRYVKFDSIMLSLIEFRDVNFKHASFMGSLMTYCSFKECDLRGANFTGATLSHADLSSAIIDEETCFDGAIFEQTRVNANQLQYFISVPKEKLIIIE